MKTVEDFLRLMNLLHQPPQAMMTYPEPYDWWALTPLFPGEPIVVYSKQRVWFVEKPYMGEEGVKYKPEIIPLQLYWNILLMKGKVLC